MELELKAHLLNSSMLKLRDFISNQINNGLITGDEIYQYLLDFVDNEDLSDEAEEKATDLMDALSGWCAPEFHLGSGKHGRHIAA
ncbi:hypothetical protein SMC38_003130 [Cronobacter sakazakii]|nr:hypothetical protein [Cronobacter sakazakii]